MGITFETPAAAASNSCSRKVFPQLWPDREGFIYIPFPQSPPPLLFRDRAHDVIQVHSPSSLTFRSVLLAALLFGHLVARYLWEGFVSACFRLGEGGKGGGEGREGRRGTNTCWSSSSRCLRCIASLALSSCCFGTLIDALQCIRRGGDEQSSASPADGCTYPQRPSRAW